MVGQNRLMQWNFEVPSIGAFTQPIQQGIRDYRAAEQQAFENERQNRLMQLQQDQFGLQKQRFGMDQQRFTREEGERAQTFPLELDAKRAGLDQARAQIAQTEAQTGQIGKTAGIQEYEYARRNGFTGSYQNWQDKARAGSVKTSLQPIYGVDDQGQPVVMQPRDDGSMVRSQMPPGVTVSRQPIKVDTGTEFILLDPITRQPVGRMPKDVAGREREEKIGQAQGTAITNLPQVQGAAERALATINQIERHPGKAYGVGAVGIIPGIPGTAQRGFIALVDQAKGQAFLEAFNALKGGGAITEIEGQKATQAIARLDRAQSPEDFDAALNDLKGVISSGLQRAKGMASTGGRPQAQQPTQPQGAAVAPGQYVYDPASGRLVPKGGN
jgi:hypothetical protein